MIRKLTTCFFAVSLSLFLAACGNNAPPNTVFGVEDLPGKTIGVILDSTGDAFASEYEEKGSVVERFSYAEDAVVALTKGDLDCVIVDEQPARVLVDKYKELTILDEQFVTEHYAFCVSKDRPELTEKFNNALAGMKDSGTLEQIIANYIGDAKGTCPYQSPADADRSGGVLTLAVHIGFEPYEFYEEDVVKGIDIDIARAFCDAAGYELKIEDMDFDSIIAAVQTGKADFGCSALTITEDRSKLIDFTDSYTSSSQVAIVRKE